MIPLLPLCRLCSRLVKKIASCLLFQSPHRRELADKLRLFIKVLVEQGLSQRHLSPLVKIISRVPAGHRSYEHNTGRAEIALAQGFDADVLPARLGTTPLRLFQVLSQRVLEI